MVMQIKRDIMIDLEFLSQKPDASVIQIAALIFGEDTRSSPTLDINTFNVYINEINGSVDMSTLQFWVQQIKTGQHHTFNQVERAGKITNEALYAFEKWIEMQEYDRIWCKGSLDFPILSTLFRSRGWNLPWDWWKEHELRTVLHVAEVDNPNGGHDALEDCKVQAQALMSALEVLRYDGA